MQVTEVFEVSREGSKMVARSSRIRGDSAGPVAAWSLRGVPVLPPHPAQSHRPRAPQGTLLLRRRWRGLFQLSGPFSLFLSVHVDD